MGFVLQCLPSELGQADFEKACGICCSGRRLCRGRHSADQGRPPGFAPRGDDSMSQCLQIIFRCSERSGAHNGALLMCVFSLQPNLSNTTNADDLFKDRTSEFGLTCASRRPSARLCRPVPYVDTFLSTLETALLCALRRDVRDRLLELDWRPCHRE